jgi:hypothetical protein
VVLERGNEGKSEERRRGGRASPRLRKEPLVDDDDDEREGKVCSGLTDVVRRHCWAI